MAVLIVSFMASPAICHGAENSKDLYMLGENDDPAYIVTASGFLRPSAIRTFVPDNAFDGDINTTWCVEGGVGNWINAEFKEQRVKSINIVAGGSGELFFQNNRPQQIRISLSDGNSVVYRFEQDNRRFHQIKIDAVTSLVKISVEYVRSGRERDVLCISEIEVISETRR
jgi:hypothetical protein